MKLPGFLTAISVGEENDYFIENLSILLSSGMGIAQTLDAIKAEIKSKKLRQIIEELQKDIDGGMAISAALEKTRLTPSHIISLIRIGESSGKLPENLKLVVAQQQKERVFRSKVRSAMLYPGIVFSLTLVIGVGIAWFILPKLANVFYQLKVELPLITRVLIALGKFIAAYGHIAIPAFLALVGLVVYLVFFYPKTKSAGQALLFAFPPVKKLIMEVELARFGYLLGLLLGAGIPIIECLNSISKATAFYRYQRLYNHFAKSVEEGNSFQKSFELYPKVRTLIPMPIEQMIISAEQSGNLPNTLLKIGEIFEAKSETTTKNLATVLEPILLVIVWLGVVAVALAVILPIYSLIGGFNQPNSAPAPQVQQAPQAQATEEAQTKEEPVQILQILPTEVGYLNVRVDPSTNSGILGQVKAPETYQYQNQEGGWYQIIISGGQTGWVFGQYVKPIDELEIQLQEQEATESAPQP